MNKKILAGVLSVASLLSLSAVAFADSGEEDTSTTQKYDSTKGSGVSYTINAGVSYGTVEVEVPKSLDGVIINPYGAAIKTDAVANKGGIASPIFEVKNLDDTDGIKVMATTSVVKATNVVVKDMKLDKTSVKGYSTDETKGVTTGCPALDSFSPLVDYSAITLVAVKGSDGKTVTGQTIKDGTGIVAATQKKNVGIWLNGATSAENVVPDPKKGLDKDTKQVYFAPKGNTTGDLGTCEKEASVFFTVYGEINPELPASTEWTEKDVLQLSVVLKVLPVVDD